MDVILWWGFYFLTFYAFLPGFISRMFGFRVFSKGIADREIALTFDDGPHPVYTPRLLDLLKAHGAHATFFVVGAHAEKHPDIVRRMYEEGHDIGIHNYVHRSNWIMGPVSVRRHVVRTGDIVERITGMRPRYYRPPWGIVNVFDFIGRGKPQIVLWTALFGDWKLKVGAERLYGKIRRKLQPGAVLLLHDCGDTFGADPDAPANTIDAVGRILEDGKREGLRFVGIGEMMRQTKLNKDEASARREGLRADPADGSVPQGRTQSAAVPMPGPFKRAVVAAWMLWEDVFGWLFRLRPVGDGKSFHYRIVRYGGPTLTLDDGERIAKGDRVLELHFVNKMMLDIGMSSRSEMQIAIRVIQLVKKSASAVGQGSRFASRRRRYQGALRHLDDQPRLRRPRLRDVCASERRFCLVHEPVSAPVDGHYSSAGPDAGEGARRAHGAAYAPYAENQAYGMGEGDVFARQGAGLEGRDRARDGGRGSRGLQRFRSKAWQRRANRRPGLIRDRRSDIASIWTSNDRRGGASPSSCGFF
ncbi:polysaccharide deacetylase family protein [Cohnella rhizosphaerae]|uniref:Polysaccharide deacetylase family protein n=1 Tax=Cohnella rhizosphaerae TaxID=1457232 RepID=A0A9X4QUT3_9BACL|nr:polysaccharide deacetylase family protein [Cohnella rhizosphaerae]MDG0812050.1 polysaccharide deacetylase family protein [Cohnella rhizosphaerae]